ncbi:hypothetical protein GN244_ATG12389 [Phytophthora infestans]|uniref:Uncharacterized protein n=1 Tax=Phytophthora infestans TaxID=4787 RepID=A0A833RYI5_PHYIN|nr:hypothetical protein GN244_ATG12389 [Phytophthora infestans]
MTVFFQSPVDAAELDNKRVAEDLYK